MCQNHFWLVIFFSKAFWNEISEDSGLHLTFSLNSKNLCKSEKPRLNKWEEIAYGNRWNHQWGYFPIKNSPWINNRNKIFQVRKSEGNQSTTFCFQLPRILFLRSYKNKMKQKSHLCCYYILFSSFHIYLYNADDFPNIIPTTISIVCVHQKKNYSKIQFSISYFFTFRSISLLLVVEFWVILQLDSIYFLYFLTIHVQLVGLFVSNTTQIYGNVCAIYWNMTLKKFVCDV